MDEQDIHMMEKSMGVEQALTQEEQNLDLSQMDILDLGSQEKYKTKIVQNRWQQQRKKWLATQQTTD